MAKYFPIRTLVNGTFAFLLVQCAGTSTIENRGHAGSRLAFAKAVAGKNPAEMKLHFFSPSAVIAGVEGQKISVFGSSLLAGGPDEWSAVKLTVGGREAKVVTSNATELVMKAPKIQAGNADFAAVLPDGSSISMSAKLEVVTSVFDSEKTSAGRIISGSYDVTEATGLVSADPIVVNAAITNLDGATAIVSSSDDQLTMGSEFSLSGAGSFSAAGPVTFSGGSIDATGGGAESALALQSETYTSSTMYGSGGTSTGTTYSAGGTGVGTSTGTVTPTGTSAGMTTPTGTSTGMTASTGTSTGMTTSTGTSTGMSTATGSTSSAGTSTGSSSGGSTSSGSSGSTTSSNTTSSATEVADIDDDGKEMSVADAQNALDALGGEGSLCVEEKPEEFAKAMSVGTRAEFFKLMSTMKNSSYFSIVSLMSKETLTLDGEIFANYNSSRRCTSIPIFIFVGKQIRILKRIVIKVPALIYLKSDEPIENVDYIEADQAIVMIDQK